MRIVDREIDHGSRSPVLEGLVEETVTVHRLALEGEEEVAVNDIAIVRRS